MAHDPCLTPIDWQLLAKLRAARDEDKPPQRIIDVLAAERPYADEYDRKLLEAATAAKSPAPARVPVALRVAPDSHRDEAAKWLANLDPSILDRVLVEFARAGPDVEIGVDRNVLIAYFAETYRIIAVGGADEFRRDESRYDGPPAILRALGSWLYPDPGDTTLYTPDEVASIAQGLTRLDLSRYPEGDLSALRDFYDDHFDADVPLDEVVRKAIADLTEAYQNAAVAEYGMRVAI